MTTQSEQVHEPGMRKTIAISGSSGLIGTALVHALTRDGHRVKHLVRRAARSDAEIAWNPERGELDRASLAGVDAIVNLAGESLDQRWTDDVKRRILESRVKATTLLAATIAQMPAKPAALFSGSAIGIYGDRGDELLDEHSGLGHGFLADVCRAWEAATRPAEDAGVRVVHLRTGVVLAKEGGALARLLTPFKFGVGGKLGSGTQWMSWIALADWVGALQFMLLRGEVRGPVDLTAPNPVRNVDLTRAVSNELHRPAIFPVPRVALKLVLGEMADEAVLASQRVLPRVLSDAAYPFQHATIESALAAILG